MPRKVYAEINLHITWHTKDNVPVLVDIVEDRLHRYLKHRALQTAGVIVHEINGMPDHIHLAVTIPPAVSVGDWIGKLKGASAYYINHEICNRKVLAWQTGYGVVSFGMKDLPWVVAYIQNQKSHHAAATVHDRLERVAQIDEGAGQG